MSKIKTEEGKHKEFDPEYADLDKLNPKKDGITKCLFLKWRNPRLSSANPTKIESPVWKWMIQNNCSGYHLNDLMEGPSSFDNGPVWTMDRFGMSGTLLPNGDKVFIGGEHEDYYDPDFNIYNDVVVVKADHSVNIFNYPKEIFPATDFHSANLIDDKIIIIGNLGYGEQRIPNSTPVYQLDLKTFSISKTTTKGPSPGWIHNHEVEVDLQTNKLKIKGGTTYIGEDEQLIDNFDDWEFDIKSNTWSKLTDRQWKRIIFTREDRNLFELGMKRINIMTSDLGSAFDDSQSDQDLSDALESIKSLNGNSDKVSEEEKEVIQALYSFPFDHKIVNDKDDVEEYGVYRISHDETIIEFKEDSSSIVTLVRGSVPVRIISTIKSTLIKKLEKIENKKIFTREY